MARAAGTGVVLGLQVSLVDGTAGRSVAIAPGHGITPSGDLVLISAPLQADIERPAGHRPAGHAPRPEAVPHQPLTRRTGLFILALRPVEFTANPIASYPTSITGPRTARTATSSRRRR